MPTTESRRRTNQVHGVTGQEDGTVGMNDVHQRRRRKPKFGSYFLGTILRCKSERRDLIGLRNSPPLFLALVLLAVLVVFQSPFFNSLDEPTVIGASYSFKQRFFQSRATVERNKELYDTVYKFATKRLLPPDQTDWPDYERRPYEMKSTYGSSVDACDLTVVVMDPRLGFPTYDFGPGQPLWFALESIGAFASEACVLLQTCE
jgi:hypothetical protein